jgi:hypothetical protein
MKLAHFDGARGDKQKIATSSAYDRAAIES